MENFFSRHITIAETGGDTWIYSKGYTARKNIIYNESGESIYEIPFVPKHFHVLAFEYFLVDELNAIYLVNKNTLEILEIGRVKDEVVALSVSRDEKWCVIASTTEILLFDSYIDFKKSIKFEFNEVIQIEWTDYEVFGVLTSNMIFFYDIELNLIGKSKEREYSSISWRSKYNVFGCSTGKEICFVEPNGLEHGDPLEVRCNKLTFLENEDLLATIENNDEGSLLKVFYTKNFHWYLKLLKQVPGGFLCSEKNAVLFKDKERIAKVFLFEEKTHSGPEYYVIDGNCILYTDFSKKIVPPPFFSVKIEFDSNVIDIFPSAKKGAVLLRDKVIIFKWNGDNFISEEAFFLGREFDSVVQFKSFLLLKSKDEFLIKKMNGGEEIRINRSVRIQEATRRNIMNEENINVVTSQLCEILNSSVDVVRCYNFEEKLYLLLEDGSVIHNGRIVHSGIDLEKRFEIVIGEDIFVHNGTKLFKNGNVTENITSFLIGEHGIITVSEGTGRFFLGLKESTCQVDHRLELLCALDFRVVGLTRHGTLETYTPKIYTLTFIRKLLLDGKYKDAIEGCQRYIIPFGVFLDYNIELCKFIEACKDTHLISFFNEALQTFGDFDFILESEKVKRFRRVFNFPMVLEPGKGKEYFEVLIANDESISDGSLEHLMEYRNGKSQEDSKLGNSRYSRDLPRDGKKLCGRNTKDFFNELFQSLDLERNFKFAIFALVKVKRMDLALQVAKHDMKGGIGYMLSITNMSNIINSALETCEEDLVHEVMKICQKDSSDFLFLIRNCEKDLRGFKINDFLKNRIDALYHISRTGMVDLEREYIQKHDLVEEALMYEACGLSIRKEGYYFNLCAELLPPEKALILFKRAQNIEKALETAIENLYWREALGMCVKERQEELGKSLASRLIDSGKNYEAGQLFEEFLGDTEKAFIEYVKAKSMGNALRLCSDGELLMKEAREILKEKLLVLDDIKKSFIKYRDRLKTLEEREDDCMSETSFSYTENRRGSKSTKVKNRPGGGYEKEFVLGKIRDIGLNLMRWRDETEDLLKVFEKFEMKECIDAHNTSFSAVGEVLKMEIDNVFGTEKRHLYESNRPIVEKPDLSKWL